MVLLRGDVGEGIVGVDFAPILVGGAVVEVGGMDGGIGVGAIGVEEGAVAAVEIPVRVVAEEGVVAFLEDGGEGAGGAPGLDDAILGEGEVPV